MQGLYDKCIETENILRAKKSVDANSGSKTAGPDGITKLNCGDIQTVIKAVKLRLRRRKEVRSKKVQIPKGNGQYREISIINYYDRIAQECVHYVLTPLIEPNMSKHSYGFKKGIGTKIPVSKACNVINQNKEIYTVEIDFEKCFDNIPLESAIGRLIEDFGIRDYLLIKTIKHLMFTGKEYRGIGLSQGTILGPLLCNVYLNSLDKFIERTFELNKIDKHFSRDYEKHKSKWIAWQLGRKRKITANYYRYADDSLIICKSREDRDYCYELVRNFIESNLEIKINQTKTELGNNEPVKFLGFAIKKSQRISIVVADPKKIRSEISSRILKTHKDLVLFRKYIIGILNYYDICNNLSYIIDKIVNRLNYQGYNKGRGILKKIRTEGNVIFEEKNPKDKRTRVNFDVWSWRKKSKISFKDILVNQAWIQVREWIKIDDRFDKGVRDFVWILFTNQKGKDYATGKPLDIEHMHVHHKIPVSKNGSNNIENLILISEETHKNIHSKRDNGNLKLKRLIKALN